MKQYKWLALIIICMLIVLSGCAVIWTDNAFIATLGKRFSMTDIVMVSDANSLQIGSGKVETTNDKLTVITPAVVVGTK